MRIAIVVCALNEERHLPELLESIERQTQLPDRLLMVDDGSSDGTPQLMDAFAARHEWARSIRRSQRPEAEDRLADAAELRAFHAALARLDDGYDVIAKLDADLRLSPSVVEDVCRRMSDEPKLGIAGPFVSIVQADGSHVRERCPAYHVRGAVKFYRRSCLEQIGDVPPILGWDTIDEATARLRGWTTRSFPARAGDVIHLRPVGEHDGRLRAMVRWGACAYAIGDHPAWLAAGTLQRMLTMRPRGVAGLAYLTGWAGARRRHAPRAQEEVRAWIRREQLRRLGAAVPVGRKFRARDHVVELTTD